MSIRVKKLSKLFLRGKHGKEAIPPFFTNYLRFTGHILEGLYPSFLKMRISSIVSNDHT